MSVFANPLIVFVLVWGIPLSDHYNRRDGFTIKNDDPVISFLFVNLVILFVCYGLLKIIFLKAKKKKVLPDLGGRYLDVCRIILLTMLIWVIGYLLVIIYSGGFPLLWVLLGDERTYVYSGFPTLSGLLNMLRVTCTTMLFIFIRTKKRDLT